MTQGTASAIDISKISVNLLLVASIVYGSIRITLVGEDIVRDVREIKIALAAVREDATRAHLDAEAVLRDRAEYRARLQVLENWKRTVDTRYLLDWNFVHGRVDRLPWHSPRETVPEVN